MTCDAGEVADKLAPFIAGGKASLPTFLGGGSDATSVAPARSLGEVAELLAENGIALKSGAETPVRTFPGKAQ